MVDEVRKGKRSYSTLDSTEIIRNIADIVDEDGVRAPGILELLSSIQADTRNIGMEPSKLFVHTLGGVATVTRQKIQYCPAGQRIVIFDLQVSGTVATTFSFTDQNAVILFSNIVTTTNDTINRSFARGLFLPEARSLYYSTLIGSITSIDVSYTMIPSRV